MLEILTAATRPRMAWKNGQGWTTELARSPSQGNANEWDWRISVAEIAADSAFSEFCGIDRSLLMLDGAGIRMFVAGRERELRIGDPALAFPGEASVRCELLAGPTRDFNVMTRRGVWRHQVSRGLLEAGVAEPGPGVRLVYVVEGAVELAERGHELGVGDSVVTDEPLVLTGRAELVVVRLTQQSG